MRRVVLGLICAAAFALAAVGCQEEPTWSDGEIVAPPGARATSTTDGDVLLAWADVSNGSTSVSARLRLAGEDWSESETVEEGTPWRIVDVVPALGAGGDAALMWGVNTNHRGTIRGAYRPDEGGWEKPATLDRVRRAPSFPGRLHVDEFGGVSGVWSSGFGRPTQSTLRSGDAWRDPVSLAAPGPHPRYATGTGVPLVALDPATRGSRARLGVRRWDGTRWRPEAGPEVGRIVAGAVVAFTDTGDAAIAWTDGPDNNRRLVVAFSDDGQAWSVPLVLAEGVKFGLSSPRIRASGDAFFVTWERWLEVGVESELSVARIGSNRASSEVHTLGTRLRADHGQGSELTGPPFSAVTLTPVESGIIAAWGQPADRDPEGETEIRIAEWDGGWGDPEVVATLPGGTALGARPRAVRDEDGLSVFLAPREPDAGGAGPLREYRRDS